ncbi:hypothetical protein IK112_01375 [Candidatus Saccharibacteria bacterium]|nr:hypothetical protein [Candidatus Saccharibacteria bacterium]
MNTIVKPNIFENPCLFPPETDLLIAVIDLALYPATLIGTSLKGDIIFQGQPYDSTAFDIFRAKMPGGSCYDETACVSEELIHIVVAEILADGQDDPSIIYHVNQPETGITNLIMNAQFGRFISSIFIQPASFARQVAVNLATAVRVISKRGSPYHDHVMQQSFNSLRLSDAEVRSSSLLAIDIMESDFSAAREYNAWLAKSKEDHPETLTKLFQNTQKHP